ncbi:hypothetical protein BIV57_02165 [Mangrovactinospora gilvigrisea]|uniref:Uncharacterized protein n=1 Tax=Mangrovactinospora gilvigrisea TaxID=1428644 RepID=A0A1J7BKN3_9ACTN|nr:hypothetical protein [Mangrovactinospora gilvigrisea]OIV39157.1 hypothetical protein BIV57_02165 [Mangrovactinospora gilvigrisea]
MERYIESNAAASALVLEVPTARWSSRLCWWPEAGGAALLVSLPRGLFVEHDEAMRRIAGFDGRAMANDVEYLTAVWGLGSGRDGELMEIPEAPLIRARVGQRQVSLELSGWPWLAHGQQAPLPRQWSADAADAGLLLGLTFDADLRHEECEEEFFDELADGRAALGLIQACRSV